jgi:hypothetical protein
MTRKRPLVRLTLSPEAWARATEIARRQRRSRSALVDELLMKAKMPEEEK